MSGEEKPPVLTGDQSLQELALVAHRINGNLEQLAKIAHASLLVAQSRLLVEQEQLAMAREQLAFAREARSNTAAAQQQTTDLTERLFERVLSQFPARAAEARSSSAPELPSAPENGAAPSGLRVG